jgi:hypothetical protein
LLDRLLPSWQWAQRLIPALEFAIGLDWIVRHIGKVHGRAERKIRERQRIAGDIFTTTITLKARGLGGKT